MKSEIKPGYGLERVILKDAVPLDMPFTLFLSVSTVCNFKCKYCIQALSNVELKNKNFIPEIMDWEIFQQAADQTMSFQRQLKTIFLYGVGEPLCNKRLPDMVSYLKKINTAEQISFITNAGLLNKEVALRLIDSGLDILRISIQGLSSEKYYEICGVKINFDELIDNIRFFYENRKNCKLFVKIVDVALDEGDEDKFYKIFANISDRMYVEKIVPVFHEIDYTKMIKNSLVTDLWGNPHETRMVCPICFYTLTVFPNGDVYPCCMESDPADLGNIKNIPLAEIWNGKTHKQFMKMQLMKKRMSNKICKHCTAPDTSAKLEDELDTVADKLVHLFE